MYRAAQPIRRVATVLILGLLAAGCGGSAKTADPQAFCRTMKQVTNLLEPNTGSTTPAGTKARYESLSTMLAQATDSAPPALTKDVAAFATAIHAFAGALAKVGYRLDAIFTTPGGAKLAADTSHALTPAIVDELVGPCALNLGPPRSPN